MSKLDLLAPESPEAALSRRSIVQTIAGTALAMTFLAGCGGSDDDDSNGNNNDSGNLEQGILQLALHLEYLEAEFYSYATTGAGIDGKVAITGIGTQGTTVGGFQTNFTSQFGAQIAREVLADELGHIRTVRTALGSAAPARPALDFATVPAALGLDPRNEADFLALARSFADVGTSAYIGGSPYLSTATLRTAARILATEGVHTGNFRLQAIQQSSRPIPKYDSKDQPPTAADPVIGAAVNYFDTDGDSLAYPRTPTEVLRIVTNQPTASTAALAANLKGGIFPAGLNLSSGNASRLLAVTN